MRIIFTSDIHLGDGYNYKRTAAGVSQRAIDFLEQMKVIVDHAIAVGAELIVIAGDLYDAVVISSNIKRLFRKNVIIPALQKKIKFLIVGGNHDSHRELTYGCDIEDLGMARGSIVVKRVPGVQKYKFGEERVGFTILPFLMPTSVLSLSEATRSLDGAISPQIASEAIAAMVPGFLEDIDGCDAKFMVGHYQIVGTHFKNMPDSYASHMMFNRLMIHENDFDLCVFGHIHQHQTLGDKIIVPGSIERVNFGERDDEKCFIDYDTVTKRWTPVKLNCRKMMQLEVMPSNDNPTSDILSRIRDVDVKDALVHLIITAKKNIINKVDSVSVKRALKDTFHKIIDQKILGDDNNAIIDLSGVNLDPASLLERYIGTKFKDDPRRDRLLQESKKYLGV